MTFAEWAKTDAEKLVRVDLKAWDGSAELSLFIASRFYRDSINSNDYLDRLIDPLIIRRSDGGAFGRPEVAVGGISIDNSDRDLDDWMDYAWHGREVVIRLGDPTWDSDDSRWSVRFRGLADRMEAEDNILTLFVRDPSERLDRPIVERPLNLHQDAFLQPFPVCFGSPQNVQPPLCRDSPDTGDPGTYIVNAWNCGDGASDVTTIVDEVYENGEATAKSLIPLGFAGSSSGYGFVFDVSDPKGTVTCDPVGARDDPRGGGSVPRKPGEILTLAFTYDVSTEAGFAQSGDADSVVLDDNASDQDDFYNGSGSPTSLKTGSIDIFRREVDGQDRAMIDDYVGSTKTATFASSIGFSIVEGDGYLIVLDSDQRRGALASSELDTASLSALDTDAPYDLGIWGEGITYLDLLDALLPGGFRYGWTADGEFSVGLLEDPSAGTSVLTIDQYETRGKIRLIQESEPIYRARVGWDRNWTVMKNPDDTVSTSRAAFLGREYQWEVSEDLSVRDAYPESAPRDFSSNILDRADAKTEADRLMTLFGVARQRIMVEGLSGVLSVDLHDVVTLKDDTYGLSGGKDFRVVSIEERPIEGTTNVELWG